MSEQKMIAAVCPVCNTSNGVSSAFVGKKVICQNCEEIFVCTDSDKSRDNIDIEAAERPSEDLKDDLPKFPSQIVRESKKIPVIAKLAIMYKYISQEQCDKAIGDWENDKKNGIKISLEEKLKRDQLLSSEQIVKLRQAMQYLEIKQKDKEFCARALEMGFILSSEATWALEKQAKEFRENGKCIRVGRILVESEAITEVEHKLINEQVNSAGPPVEIPDFQVSETEDDGTGSSEAKGFFNKDLIRISVSEDGLKAYLSVAGEQGGITVSNVREVLEEKCITYGVVENRHIDQFLKNWASSKRQFKIAEGSYPVLGANASVKYYFETDHLKAGALSESGSIDFKDRGTIPFVKKGDLLAEKIPARSGSPGIDIYGNPISVDAPLDIELSCGIGTIFLDDRTKIFADVNGYPSTTIDHVISVVQGIDIKGDVGYETGHVEFDGHINVEGIVKEGFRVKGTSLCAREIVGAQIDVTGDIIVQDGIIGSKIRTQGNIEATYLRDTKILSFGNINVLKQIIDSNIVSSGICQVIRGAILSSDISARKGVKAYDIGTDISAPNKIRVGTDLHVEKILDEIKVSLEEREKEKSVLNEGLVKVKEDLQNVFNLIAEMAHVQDRAMKQKASILETMEKFSQKKNQRKLGPAEKSLKELEEQVQNADHTIDRLFATQNAYKDKIENIKEKIKSVNDHIISLNSEKNAIRQFAEREKSDPTITVFGSIQDKTIVMGKKSSRILEETYRNVRIKEVKVNDPGLKTTWEMRIYNKTY